MYTPTCPTSSRYVRLSANLVWLTIPFQCNSFSLQLARNHLIDNGSVKYTYVLSNACYGLPIYFFAHPAMCWASFPFNQIPAPKWKSHHEGTTRASDSRRYEGPSSVQGRSQAHLDTSAMRLQSKTGKCLPTLSIRFTYTRRWAIIGAPGCVECRLVVSLAAKHEFTQPRAHLIAQLCIYRAGLKSGPVLLSNNQARPGRNFSQPRVHNKVHLSICSMYMCPRWT